MSDKVVGIIRNVGIGNRDCGVPVLHFSVYVSECLAALQIINWDRANDIIKESKVYDVKDLEGRPCWCDVGTPGMIRFERLWRKP